MYNTKQLKRNAISRENKNSTGPANFMMTDPDGNMILIDQHV